MTKTRTAGAVAVSLVAGALLGWWLWPSTPEPPRARQYTAKQACLLTDQQGQGSPQAADAWAALQASSAATRAKVWSLPVVGEDSVGNAVPYATTLVARQCNVIVATGTTQIQAVTQIAPTYPKVRFVVVGNATATANLTAVSPTADAKTAITNLVTTALRQS